MPARIPMVSLERAKEVGAMAGLPPHRTTSNAFRIVAQNPEVAKVAFGQLTQLLEHNKLDFRLRELMIMRIGWVTGSGYEWTQHWHIAVKGGVPAEDVLAVRNWRNSTRLGPADRAVLAAVDESLGGGSITDATWAEVTKHIPDPAHQVEFVIDMGNWLAFSMLFRNLRIPLPDDMAIWPPDGVPSPNADK